ncbi:hypothetical protein ACLG6S_14100 [Thermodesulfobacteriota bacterium B35]
MLVPREEPYMQGLNSYYLDIARFVEHLQGEIGSGCIYGRSSGQEILVYFDEQEILRGIIQDSGERARVSDRLTPVLEALARKSFNIRVYHLDANAIFFWGQLPPFKRARATLKSSDIPLPELIFRLKQKRFSGFVDVRIQEKEDSAILFFHTGRRIGGSYSWGRGGLNGADEEYNRLLARLQAHGGTFAVGHFLAEKSVVQKAEKAAANDTGDQLFSNLDTALEEFLDIYLGVMGKKKKTEPVLRLKQTFLDRLDDYPFLDPFLGIFDYVDGSVQFADDAPRNKIAAAVVDCVWQVITAAGLEKKFRQELGRWSYRTALEERGIAVER